MVLCKWLDDHKTPKEVTINKVKILLQYYYDGTSMETIVMGSTCCVRNIFYRDASTHPTLKLKSTKSNLFKQ